MKILYFLFFTLSFSYAQPYLPMLEADHIWSVDLYGIDGGIRTDQIQIEGSEVFNGISYHKFSSYESVCYAREENGIVYQYSGSTSNSEHIMYDFTLEINDFFTFWWESCLYGIQPASGGAEFQVTNIETQFIAGMDRKVIELKDDATFPYFTEYWIEGIGSLKGFDPHSELIDAGQTSLACFSVNGITYFFNGATACDNTALDINDFSSEEIILYPNPIINRSILQLPVEASIDRIIILDIHGRIIKAETLSKEYYTINSMNYRSGIYFYQVFNDRGLIKTGPFIVK
jgi:hypothetical protein